MQYDTRRVVSSAIVELYLKQMNTVFSEVWTIATNEFVTLLVPALFSRHFASYSHTACNQIYSSTWVKFASKWQDIKFFQSALTINERNLKVHSIIIFEVKAPQRKEKILPFPRTREENTLIFKKIFTLP